MDKHALSTQIKTADSRQTGVLPSVTRHFSALYAHGPGYEAMLWWHCRIVMVYHHIISFTLSIITIIYHHIVIVYRHIAIVVYPLLHCVTSRAIELDPSRYKVFCLTLLPKFDSSRDKEQQK